jgi:hypothetical protein
MAVELESKIMMGIGLGNHYTWFNGSGSCEYIRKAAARKLPEVIRKYSLEKKDGVFEIAEPDERLCLLLLKVANLSDVSEYSLTRTWTAASDIIREHMCQANKTPLERKEAFDKMCNYLQENYLNGIDEEVIYNDFEKLSQ